MATASAPASAANLGPGFDVLALALDIRCEVEVIEADEWSVMSDGRRLDDDAARFITDFLGTPPRAVFVRSPIPAGRGLGSSAAVRAAASAAADTADGVPTDREAIIRRVAVAEGHPDNAAAAVYGGLAFVDAVGGVHRLAVHPSIEVLVAVPDLELSTEEARSVLPDTVERPVVVRTAARVAALVEGLRTADPSVLAGAAGDEVHEPARAHLSPSSSELVDAARRAGALHACWSGAGPSVLALVNDENRAVVRSALEETLEGGGEVLEPGIDRLGIVVDQ